MHVGCLILTEFWRVIGWGNSWEALYLLRLDLRIGLEFLALRFRGLCSRSTASTVLVDPSIHQSLIHSYPAPHSVPVHPAHAHAKTYSPGTQPVQCHAKALIPFLSVFAAIYSVSYIRVSWHTTSPLSRKSLDSFLVSISAAIYSVSYIRVSWHLWWGVKLAATERLGRKARKALRWKGSWEAGSPSPPGIADIRLPSPSDVYLHRNRSS